MTRGLTPKGAATSPTAPTDGELLEMLSTAAYEAFLKLSTFAYLYEAGLDLAEVKEWSTSGWRDPDQAVSDPADVLAGPGPGLTLMLTSIARDLRWALTQCSVRERLRARPKEEDSNDACE